MKKIKIAIVGNGDRASVYGGYVKEEREDATVSVPTSTTLISDLFLFLGNSSLPALLPCLILSLQMITKL